MPGQDYIPVKHPRNETFFDLWKNTFCPMFRFCSVIFFICLIQFCFQIAMFIHTLLVFEELNDNFFLGPQLQTLQKFGMRMPWMIRAHGDVHRWFMPSMLHFGFSHFVINIILQVALGTIVESVLGPLRMVAFYAIVALGSNLFGGTVTATYATGSEGVIYGFIGALFSIILVYWGRIGGTTCTKVCTVFMVVTVFIMATFLMTTTASTASRYTSFFRITYPDLYGSIGGFLYGLFASMFLLPRALRERGKVVWRETGIFLLGVFAVIAMTAVLLIVFFAGKAPE